MNLVVGAVGYIETGTTPVKRCVAVRVFESSTPTEQHFIPFSWLPESKGIIDPKEYTGLYPPAISETVSRPRNPKSFLYSFEVPTDAGADATETGDETHSDRDADDDKDVEPTTPVNTEKDAKAFAVAKAETLAATAAATASNLETDRIRQTAEAKNLPRLNRTMRLFRRLKRRLSRLFEPR